MEGKQRIYIGNFTNSEVLVAIDGDNYVIHAKSCPLILREIKSGTSEVRMGYKTENPKAVTAKEINFAHHPVIGICESLGELHFCEIGQLAPTVEFKLAE